MATLLHFLRSLVVALLVGFLLALTGLSLLLGGLMAIDISPMSFIVAPVYVPISQFFAAFGGGDRIEGIIAIALTVGVVVSLLDGFSAYKRSQRSEWRLAVSNASKD